MLDSRTMHTLFSWFLWQVQTRPGSLPGMGPQGRRRTSTAAGHPRARCEIFSIPLSLRSATTVFPRVSQA